MTDGDLRDVFVSCAVAVEDLGADPRKALRRESYLRLIAPGEGEQTAWQMAAMSGCGLVVAGIWRAAGVRHPRLDPPYRIGSAISRLVSIARASGAWCPYRAGELPGLGDAVLVGGGNPGDGVEHIYTVITVALVDGAPEIVSVDGGQRDAAGYQVIRRRHRTWSGGRDIARASSDPGAKVGTGRRIVGWVDVTRLPRACADAEAPVA